jgi:hypothetical protein
MAAAGAKTAAGAVTAAADKIVNKQSAAVRAAFALPVAVKFTSLSLSIFIDKHAVCSTCGRTTVQAQFTRRRLGRIMDWIGRAAIVALVAIVALTMLTLAPVRAEAPGSPHPTVAPERACLSQKERQAAIQSGKVINLAAAMRTAKKRMPGTVVRASLCQGKEGLVYVLTVLARDGKVARLTVDAVKGTLVGQR